jgi:hypothetical protein
MSTLFKVARERFEKSADYLRFHCYFRGNGSGRPYHFADRGEASKDEIRSRREKSALKRRVIVG